MRTVITLGVVLQYLQYWLALGDWVHSKPWLGVVLAVILLACLIALLFLAIDTHIETQGIIRSMLPTRARHTLRIILIVVMFIDVIFLLPTIVLWG